MTRDELIDAFIAERCVLDPDVSTLGPELYVAFVSWAECHLDAPMLKSRAFARHLHKRGLKRGRREKSNGPYYRNGIRLQTFEEVLNREHPDDSVAGSSPEPAPPLEVSTDQPPEHLSSVVAEWWRQIDSRFKLETHQRMILTLACQTWDHAHKLDAAIREHGTCYSKANGTLEARPEVVAFAEATREFRHLLKELGFDLHQPSKESQPPRITEHERAVALRGNEAATEYFQARGWTVIERSVAEPYDLLCRREDETLHVKVKGTTGAGETLSITQKEFQHAQDNPATSVLFVQYQICLDHDENAMLVGIGGFSRIIWRWKPDDADLVLKYQLPQS